MSETKIKVKPVDGQVVVYTANELDRKPPKQVHRAGMAHAPYEFIKDKEGVYDYKDATLYVNFTAGTTELVLNETDPYTNHVIVGEVQISAESKEIGCNSKEYTVDSLRNFIQFHPQYFADKKVRSELLRQLYNFKANFTSAVENFADLKAGSRKVQLEKKAEDFDLRKKFQLSFPLLKGAAPEKWNIELFLQVQNDELQISLYCEELLEKEQSIKVQEVSKVRELMAVTFPCSQVIIG